MILLLIIIIILVFCINKLNLFDDTVEVYYEGFNYRVRDGNMNTAKKLHELRAKLIKLVDHCVINLPDKTSANRLAKRFFTMGFNETSSTDSSAAYVVNKQELRLCLKGKENDTMFVLLHELAHVMSGTYGHNEEFKDNMKILVKEAVKLGIYQPTDYTKTPVDYCGVTITSTPCHNNQCLFGKALT